MARTCTISNIIQNQFNDELQKLLRTTNIDSEDFSDKIKELCDSKKEFLSTEEIQTILKQNNIDLSFVSVVEGEQTPQLQNQSLDFANISTLYQNANAAFGHMKHMFKTGMFKATFLDNTNYKDGRKVLRVPLTSDDVNLKIAQFKNELIKTIIDSPLINGDFILVDGSIYRPKSNQIFKYIGNKSTVDEDAYIKILTSATVTSFINNSISKLHNINGDNLELFSALFILNNFDELVSEFLPKILTIFQEKKGTLSNMKYTKDLEGNEPNIWSVDDLTTYGSDLYASNLGKFILGTINKVDANDNPIKGAYMASQDAFVLASLLREAEDEYHIKYKGDPDYNPNLLIKKDLGKSVKTFMEMGLNGELECLKKFRKEILPIYNWLYNSDENSDIIGVRQIYRDLFKSGRVKNITSVLNLENVLLGEIVKNAAPVLLEYSAFNNQDYQGSPIRTINVAHVFRGTSYITQYVKEQIFDILKLDASERNPILQQIAPISIEQVKDNSEESDFNKLFYSIFQVQVEEILPTMSNASIEKKYQVIQSIMNTIKNNIQSALESTTEEFEVKFEELFQDSFISKKAVNNNNYTNLIQAIADIKADIPITVIRNKEGKQIPIYRICSTVFEQTYLMQSYKVKNTNRNYINFLVGNPHFISKFNNNETTNSAFQGPIGLNLETLFQSGTNPANNSSGRESYLNSFLGTFMGLGANQDGHSMGIQLMTFSDKASIFVNMVNLDGILQLEGTPIEKYNGRSLNSLTNSEIMEVAYFYKRNLAIDNILHIINTWSDLLNLGLKKDESEFWDIFSAELEDSTSLELTEKQKNLDEYITNAWNIINNKLSTFSKKDIENLIRANPTASLTKELHYCVYGKSPKKIALNKNIYYRYKQVKTLGQFQKKMQYYVDKNLKHPWYKDLERELKTRRGETLLKNYRTQIGKDDASLPYLIERKTILESLFREAMLDLDFKSPALDAIKNIDNYNEFEDETSSIIESDKRFKAAGKRTVAIPGTGCYFAQGLIDGVSPQIKAAHIEGPTEEVFNPLGDTTDLEIDNGAGRIHYVYAMMESASMTGSPFKGINRKTLGEHVDDYYCTLYKWAEYLINNWHMRNSTRSKYNLQDLFRKMSNISWETEDIDLTKSFLGKSFIPQHANNGKSVYFASGLHYYKLNGFKRVAQNTYNIIITEVNKYGQELQDQIIPPYLKTKNVEIIDLYELFLALGGTESMSLNDEGILEYSDSSLNSLYGYVVNIGSINEDKLKELGVYNQETVYQPLRDKFIAIAASDTGLKRGQTNLNSKDVYTDAQKQLLTTQVNTALFRVQMDVFHNIGDSSESTEPRQTLAALATNGNTREEANDVYRAIASIVSRNMKTVAIAANIEYNEDTAERIIWDLSKDITKTVESTGIDLQSAIVELCQERLNGLIPISDQIFYSAFHSYNIQQLNKLALRRKYSGLGGVLNPSSNSYQLFTINGKQLEYDDLIKQMRNIFEDCEDILSDFTTDQLVNLYIAYIVSQNNILSLLEQVRNTKTGSEELLQIINDIELNKFLIQGKIEDFNLAENLIKEAGHKLNSPTEADPLDTVFYKDQNGDYYKLTLDTAEKYFNFVVNDNITEVYLDISTPSDLKPQIIKYVDTNNQTHSLYDSDAAQLNFQLNNLDFNDLSEINIDNIEEGNQSEQICKL